jgi:hypothetical protein
MPRGEGWSTAWRVLLAVGVALLLGSAGIASAQEIEKLWGAETQRSLPFTPAHILGDGRAR